MRPNQDITVRLWQPRPLFLQLNEPLNLASPDLYASVVSAPVAVELFDAATGCARGIERPRFEIGLTDPHGQGPWQALQVRFRAVRSRPPQPELALDIPPSIAQVPAPRNGPSPFITRAFQTDLVGSWQVPPFEARLVDFVGSGTVTSYISSPVLSPPGDPARIEMGAVPRWSEGWNRITLRMSARVRPARLAVPARSILGFQGSAVTWTDTTVALPPPPPVVPPYQIQWDPLVGGARVHAYNVTGQQLKGNGTLSSTVTVTGTFSLVTESGDHILAEVSLDDSLYGGSVSFNITEYESVVIYYRITILSGGTTPSGNLPIGIDVTVTGPDFTTPDEIIAWPDHTSPFIISISADSNALVPLETLCRVKVTPWGNDLFDSQPALYTGTLTGSWVLYQLEWDGFWDQDQIQDLHFDLQAVPLVLGSDSPFIDIDIFEAEIVPYCPGLDPSPATVPPSQIIALTPMADLRVTGWSPTPVYAYLLSDTTRVSSDFVSVDPRTDNGILLGFSDPTSLPLVADGYTRRWVRVDAQVQARRNVTGSTRTHLTLATNFGPEQDTGPLTDKVALYHVSWDQGTGLTLDQVDRVELSLSAVADVVGSDVARVDLLALSLTATYQDVFTGMALPPPPMIHSSYVTVIDPLGEVFSCGSLGGCSGSPVGRRIGRVSINNVFGSARSVMFVADHGLHIRVFDTDTPATEYILTYSIPSGTQVNFSIFGWVGSSGDPYPLEPATGQILISFSHDIGVEDKKIGWEYLGF